MLNPDFSPSGRRLDGPRTMTAPLALASLVERRVVAGATVSGANLLLAHQGAVGAWLASGRASIGTVERGLTVVQRGERVPHVYFPATAVLGVLSTVADGRHLQTLAIGREGSTAAVSLLDGGGSISQVIVQLPGRVVRVDSGAVADEAAA